MINKIGQSTTFSNYSVIFERRNHRQAAIFPLIDSSGTKILHDRRACVSIHLKRIKVEEILLKEKEFKELFKKLII